MSRASSPYVGPFLQAKIEEWVKAEPGRNAADLARRSGLSESLVSRIRNHGIGAGWQAAKKIGRVLGYAGADDVEAAARQWWISSGRKEPTSVRRLREEHDQLAERDEWEEVVRQAREERPEIDAEDFNAVGEVYDSEVFPRPLTVKFVGNLAYCLFVERRSKARPDKERG